MYEYLYINRDEKKTRKNERKKRRKKNQKYNSYISHKNSPDQNIIIILDEQGRNSIDK